VAQILGTMTSPMNWMASYDEMAGLVGTNNPPLPLRPFPTFPEPLYYRSRQCNLRLSAGDLFLTLAIERCKFGLGKDKEKHVA